ncbi:MAG: hypothetical protein KGL95_13090 [Patescibacteria group bacterium]|nr:hypothetical protein [Patescibacteria group bacterium]
MAIRPEHAETLPRHHELPSAPASVEVPQPTRRRRINTTHGRLLWIRSALAGIRPTPPSPSVPKPTPFLLDSLVNTLQQQQKTRTSANVVVCDVDGTIYSNLSLRSLLHARKVNRQTAQMIKEHHIPVIADTGARFAQYKMWALGLGTPDVIITGFGTRVLYKTRIPFVYKTGERNGKAHLIRVKNTPVVEIAKRMESLMRPGYRTVRNENIRGENTTERYSGTIAVIPESAGKDKTLTRVLETTVRAFGKPIVVHTFGDSLGDEGIITLPSTEHIRFYGHGVQPKPLLRNALFARQAKEVSPGLYHEHFQTGPVMHRNSAPEAILEVIADITDHVPNARNSVVRQIATYASRILPINLYSRKTSPNEITLNGFRKVTEATEQLHQIGSIRSRNLLTPKGLATWIRTRIQLFKLLDGYGDDFRDGLQARRLKGKRQDAEAKLGPFLDPLTDRAREIQALGLRAADRLLTNPAEALTTYKAMIACVLPSLARSFVEAATGNAVPESSGGSMLARTKMLINSQRAQLRGDLAQSFAIDKATYINGVQTFQEREAQAVDSFNRSLDVVEFVQQGVEQDPTKPKQTQFRNTAFMRMGMNVEILQQLDDAIRAALTQYPSHLAEYEQFMLLSGARKYVALDIAPFSELDKRLQLSKFLQLEGHNLFAVQPHLPQVV